MKLRMDPDVTHREGDDDGHIGSKRCSGSIPDVRDRENPRSIPTSQGKREREAQKVGQKPSKREETSAGFIYGWKFL